MREPLLLPALAVAGGIGAAKYAGLSAGELGLPLLLLAAVSLIALGLGLRRAAAAACLTALAVAGALRWSSSSHTQPPELDAAPRELLLFAGCVVEPPEFFADRERFVLELAPGARAQVTLYRAPDRPLPELAYGMQVEVEGRARPARNFANPGSFDYAGYLKRRGIYWNVSATRAPVRVLPGACGNPVLRQLYRWRAAVLRRIEQLYPEQSYVRAMLEAVLVGSDAGLEKAWTETWRRTGTYHAIVISGLQITVLAAVFVFLLRMLLLPEMAALAATTAAAWLYALISGAEPPVIRAAAGFTLFVAARWLYRRVQLLNLLAAAALAFLLVDPAELFDPSFQLSFLAVAAIAALAAPILKRTTAPLAHGLQGIRDRGRDPGVAPRAAALRVELRLLAETSALWLRVPEGGALVILATLVRAALWAFELAVVSLAVQIGLALPMAAYFHRLSLSGLSANLLIGPLMSAVVPVGFVAVVAGWAPAVNLAGRLIEVSRQVVEAHARWEPNWRIPDPPWWLGLAITATLVALAWSARRHPRWLLPGSAVLGGWLTLLVAHPFAPDLARGSLELAVLDVGQSECLLVSLPEGTRMLVDAGGIPAIGNRRPRLDIGEDVVSAYLWRRGLRRLDVAVATHGHEDHIGGLPAVIENFRPRELWYGVMPETPLWRRIRAAAQRCGTRLVRRQAGDRVTWGGVSVEVLAPEPDQRPGTEPHNDDSLVLALAFRRHRFLLTGDIEGQAEWELIERGRPLRAQILKVPHHGGRSSAEASFLDQVHPALALISVGFANAYNLPHRSLLQRLAERRVLVLRTDRHGLIRVLSDGRYLTVQTVGWGAGALKSSSRSPACRLATSPGFLA